MNDSEVWRNRVNEISDEYDATVGVIATFMSDFPGFTLTKCIQPELVNASVEMLEGEVILEINGQPNSTLKTREKAHVFINYHIY